MSRRSRAREVVLQLLYRDDLNAPGRLEQDIEFLNNRLGHNRQLVSFARQILEGVRAHQTEIDARLRETAQNWRLERMAATDRNVLRIGAFELLFGDTPSAVAINEAIELSRRYGDHRSPKFVNGVLDRLRQVAQSSGLTSAAPNDPANDPPRDSSTDLR